MGTPKSIKKHKNEYKNSSWRNYSFEELAGWVHLLSKRAKHRTEKDKAEKDFYDAQNYLNMMQSKLDEMKKELKKANK